MTYIVLADSLAPAFVKSAGPVGVAFDRKLILVVSVIPTQLLSTFAIMSFGWRMRMAVELAAAFAFYAIAIGLWRSSGVARLFAIVFSALETLLLGLWVCYVVPALSVTTDEGLRPFSLAAGLPFLALYGWIVIYLLRTKTSGNKPGTNKPGTDGWTAPQN
jgi:hypothetical protein